MAPTLAPRPAAADFYVHLAETNVSESDNFGQEKQYDSGYLAQASVANAQATSYAIANGANSMSASTTVDATASLGHLGGSALAAADNEGANANSEVYALMETRDDITAVGPTRPDGYIHLPYHFTLTDTITTSGDLLPFPPLPGALFVVQVQGAASLRLDVSDFYYDPYAWPRTFSGGVLLTPGQQITVLSLLEIHPFVNSGGGPATYDVVADQSLDFHLDNDPLTGGSYTTASGVTYFSTTVPEPSRAGPTGLGALAALAAGATRRKGASKPCETR